MNKKNDRCNKCGSKLKIFEDFDVSYRFEFGTNYDGDNLNLKLCRDCLKEEVERLISICKINPITKR